MTINNLDRDMHWITTPVGMATPASSILSSSPTVATDGVLYSRHAYLNTNVEPLAGTAGQYVAYGLKFSWADLGPIAYRIKGCCNIAGALWGFAWSSNTSAFVSTTDQAYFQVGNNCDELVCIRNKASWVDEHPVFYIRVPADAGDTIVHMSVQCLIGKPDPYTSAVR